MAVNKVVINGENGEEILIDLTGDGVTPQTLAEGITAHDASGNVIVGMMVANGDPIPPDYIVAEAERVAGEVETHRTEKSLIFPVMSDMHLYVESDLETHENSLLSAQYAGMGVTELNKRIPLDFVGYLGDYTWGPDNYTVEQVKKDIATFRQTTDASLAEIWCVGNHDLNYGYPRDRLLTLYELYACIGENADGVKPYNEEMGRCYGYLDFDSQKIRVIYLNTCDASELVVREGKRAPAGWISPTQIQWLADTALDFSDKDTPSEWGIVIMSHHPLHDGASDSDNTMKILEYYRDGKSGEISCTIRTEYDTNGNASSYPQQKVTYDFAGKERAEIICNIHGHNHNCGYSQISSSTRTNSMAVTPWLWRFCIPNICANRYNTGIENAGSDTYKQKLYGEFDADGNPVEWTKTPGTAEATSFCVVNIDRQSKKAYVHIFGAGTDRVIEYTKAYEPIQYNISVSANSCAASSGNPTTIAEYSTATLTFTANDGYELPDNVTVTGASHTWDKTNGTLTLSKPASHVSVGVTAVEKEPEYVNQIPISTNASGAIFNGKGWKENTKLSSSSGAETSGSAGVTGYIPIGIGSGNNVHGEQVIYLANIEALPTDASNVRISFYDANKAHIMTKAANGMSATEAESNVNYTLGSNGYIASLDVGAYTSYLSRNTSKNTAFFRFSAPGIDGDSIITVNQPIV